MKLRIKTTALLLGRVSVNAPPASSPWIVGGERGGNVPCGFLQPSANDGDMNALVEQVLDEAVPALHHRHAFHQVAQALIGYVASRSRLDQGQVKFDPLPLIQQTLIVQLKGFIVRDPQLVVNKLPRREVVDQNSVHVKANQRAGQSLNSLWANCTGFGYEPPACP